MSSNTIVIDNGSGVIKAGFAGEDAPVSKFPSIVGRPKYNKTLDNLNGKEEYVGDEAMKMAGVVHLKYPIDNGIVTDWEDMEKVW